jgi:hypothetical protein
MGALVMQLFVLVASATAFRFVDAEHVSVPFQGYTLVTGGYMTCEAGRPEITLAARTPGFEVTLAHELAHAVDCLDDGEMNGSPLPADATLARPLTHCLANRAEFYACWTVEQGVSSHTTAVLAEPAAFSGD